MARIIMKNDFEAKANRIMAGPVTTIAIITGALAALTSSVRALIYIVKLDFSQVISEIFMFSIMIFVMLLLLVIKGVALKKVKENEY